MFTPDEVRMSHRAGIFTVSKNKKQNGPILDSMRSNMLEVGQWLLLCHYWTLCCRKEIGIPEISTIG